MLGTVTVEVKSWHSDPSMSSTRRSRLLSVVFLPALAALAALAACAEPAVPPPPPNVRPSPALVVAHVDATLVAHVDVATLRRSSFGPAANGKLLAEIAKMANVPFVASCGQTAAIDAFDDLVVSWKGANVHVGATFAKGLSEATKDNCAHELAASADRRGDLMVSPPGLALEKGGAEAHANVLLAGPRLAAMRGKVDDVGTVEANIDADATGTTANATLTTLTPIRARELSSVLDRILAAPLEGPRRAKLVEEAHVVQGSNVVVTVRLLGDAHTQEIAGTDIARALAARSLGDKSTAGLGEVRAKLGAIGDALERHARANSGGFPPGSRWVPGVTPRGTRVPVVSDSAQDEAWSRIGISWRNERTAFRYRFVTSPDGKVTTVEAHGDLDGNEKESTFRLTLEAKADGTVTRSKVEETDPSE